MYCHLQIKYPSQAPAAICCVLCDPEHGLAHMTSTFWKNQQHSPHAFTNDAEQGLGNLLRNINGTRTPHAV